MVEKLFFLGIALIFIGIGVLIIASYLSGSGSKGRVEYGFGGFIGPIPFGFANNPQFLYVIIMLVVIVFILSFFFR